MSVMDWWEETLVNQDQRSGFLCEVDSSATRWMLNPQLMVTSAAWQVSLIKLTLKRLLTNTNWSFHRFYDWHFHFRSPHTLISSHSLNLSRGDSYFQIWSSKKAEIMSLEYFSCRLLSLALGNQLKSYHLHPFRLYYASFNMTFIQDSMSPVDC